MQSLNFEDLPISIGLGLDYVCSETCVDRLARKAKGSILSKTHNLKWNWPIASVKETDIHTEGCVFELPH